MRQTFTTRKTRGLHLRRGDAALLAGGILLTLLLAGHGMAWTAGSLLHRSDAAYRQPPHLLPLQRLLHRPAVTLEPYHGGADGLDALLGGEGSDPARNDGSRPRIVSRPLVTAVVGRAYRYQLRAEGPPDALRFRVVEAPGGLTLTGGGLVRWTPTPDQAGGRGYPVAVAVLGADGRGTRQSFTVIVSERVHWLGTDEAGRDLGAALVLGARWTLLPGLLAAMVAVGLGVLAGGLAGYYEGRTNALLTYLSALSESVPALVLLFLAAVIFQYRLLPVMAVLGLVLFPGIAQDVRARVLTLKARQFVEAARELGLRPAEILWKDIVWHNTRPLLLGRVFYVLALAVAVEVTLSYLRLGIQPPAVSWGTLLFAGRGLIESHRYWLAFFPALATILTIAGYTLLGYGLTRRLRIRGT